LDLSLPSRPLRREKRLGIVVSGARVGCGLSQKVEGTASQFGECVVADKMSVGKEENESGVAIQRAARGEIWVAAMRWVDQGEKEIFWPGRGRAGAAVAEFSQFRVPSQHAASSSSSSSLQRPESGQAGY
jgi:hypothetical protein